ncbi:MAG: Ig-like domain-containing protein [Burkholderiaceae bacterium]
MKTGSTEVVTLTVLVKDAGNAAVANAPVQFSATGGVLSAATATTDATGVARVTLSAGDDLTNKLLTVTTKVGTLAPVTSSINLIGTALSIGGPSGTVAGRATNYVITLKDAAGNPLPNKPITVSASGATVTPASGTTGSTGQLNISLQPNSGVATTSEGCQPVVFVGSSTSPTANFGVSRGKLYSNPSCTTELSASQTVNLTPSGATASTTLYAASTAPGTAIITATSGGGSTSLNLRYVATVPASLVTQASPSVVAPGAGVTVQAIVKDVAGNPVEGKTVFFRFRPAMARYRRSVRRPTPPARPSARSRRAAHPARKTALPSKALSPVSRRLLRSRRR